MSITSDVHARWLHRFITAPTPPPLILMQCDKMQNAVKRKVGKIDRKEEEDII